jgi:hypothetical protein
MNNALQNFNMTLETYTIIGGVIGILLIGYTLLAMYVLWLKSEIKPIQ